uniref:SLC13 family permease n=1 Tax=Nocardia farcinica TaxID=37329 RepID=UPI00358DD176
MGAGEVFATLADPVIILFIGGFLIADGAATYDVDRNLAALLLRPFAAGGARRTVLGLMLITALLSMFVSNTATTAIPTTTSRITILSTDTSFCVNGSAIEVRSTPLTTVS